MENKNIHNFRENRFIWRRVASTAGDSAGAAHEAAPGGAEKARENREATIDFLAELRDKGKDIGVEGLEDPTAFLDSNPFKADLLDLGARVDTEGNLDFTVEHDQGKLTLTFIDGTAPIGIEGNEYIAVFWKNFRDRLTVLFEGKNVTDELINLAIERDTEKFNDLLDVLYADGLEAGVDAQVVADALAELESLRPGLAPDERRERGRVAAAVVATRDRDAAKAEVEERRRAGGAGATDVAAGDTEKSEKLPELPDRPVNFDNANFAKWIDSSEAERRVDGLLFEVERETYEVGVKDWVYNTEIGLKRIKQDCENLGVDVTNEYYTALFDILRDGINNPYSSREGFSHLFANPANYIAEISKLPVEGGFSGELYAKALTHLLYIRNLALMKDKNQLNVSAAQESLDKDPVAEKITDVVRDNVSKFQKAVKEKDWATAGMYVLGIWAIYKSVQKLSHGKHGESAMNWIIYGTAAYCGYVFAKNAGYDILKIAGLRDVDYEVKGTPLEYMRNILASNPEYKNLANDLDYNIVAMVADVKLETLQDLYVKANRPGVQMILPTEFPELFPELARLWPFKMGRGEDGIHDSGMANEHLNPNQKEFIRVGEQLFKIAHSMRGIYESTLMVDHPVYKGVPYEKMLTMGSRKDLKVRHLMGEMQAYTTRTYETPFTKLDLHEAQDKLHGIFARHEGVGFYLHEKLAAGHFTGWLNGFPVVFVLEDNSYRVYLKNKYGGIPNPGRDTIAIIPLEGSDSEIMAKQAIDRVEARMLELLDPVLGAQGGTLAPGTAATGVALKFENGKWYCPVTFPADTEFGKSAATTHQAEITPSSDGMSVSIKTEGNFRINLDDQAKMRFIPALTLLPDILGQAEFEALQVFSNGRALSIEDPQVGDKKLDLIIGRTGRRLTLEHKGGKFVIEGGSTKEKELVSSPSFASDYIDALENDEQFELNQNIQKMKDLIGKSANEDSVKYFFKTLAQDTANSPLDGINFDLISGSIPEYFSAMVLETSKREVYERLRRAIMNANSLADVEKARNDILKDFNSRLQTIYSRASAKNAQLGRAGKAWDRDEYMSEVIMGLRRAGSVSSAYERSKADFEYLAYSVSMPGLLKKSDLSPLSHKIAGELMGVYVYYTAYLDNHMYKGAGTTDVYIDLDNLKYPPVATPGIADSKEDPAFRGNYILRYLEYVKTEIYNRAQSHENLSSIAHGSARNFWDIKDFESWKKTEGEYSALDPLDDKPAFAHDPLDHDSDKNTELDKELIKAYVRTFRSIASEYSGIIDEDRVHDYLHKPFMVSGVITPYDKIGLLSKFPDPRPGPRSGKPFRQIWEESDKIARISGASRGTQVRKIEEAMEKFVEHIFTYPDPARHGELYFFKSKPRFSSWLRHKFPSAYRAWKKVTGII